MKSSLLTKVAGFLAGLSLASAAFAATPPASQGGSATPDSGNLSQKASRQLARLHQDAQAVLKSADTLEGYNRESFMIDWRADARTLDRMRSRIDDMDHRVYLLRAMEGNLPQAQKAEINEITPAILELTNTAQTAIDYLRNNQDRTMFPQYTAYAGEMYSEAARIEHATTASRS
jgi:uncharacterized protein (DUF1778 family)